MVDPDPVPLAGETVNQELLSEALQAPPWQPLGDPEIATFCEPAPELGLADDGLMVKLVHVGGVVPDWLTENVLPAIVALSDRDEEEEFCVHATVVNPDPVPLAGEIVNQELLSEELQFPPWQPVGNEPAMVTACDPAAELGLADAGLIVNVVQTEDGPAAVLNVKPFPTEAQPTLFLAQARN